MSRAFSMLLLIPLWFLAVIYLCGFVFFRNEVRALEDWHLKQVVNNCTDSAIEELLEAADLGMDYASWNKFNADPDLALKDFVDTFLLNFNLPLTDDNREMVKINYIQAFCVAAFDGYYVYDHRKTADNGALELVSSPKIPYLYKDTSKPNRHVTYALNMGYDKVYKLTDATISRSPSPLSRNEVMKVINNRISDDLRERIDRAYEVGWLQTLYIPSGLTTISSTNPIQSPTVLAFLDNVDIGSINKVNAFGIGGSRAKVARPISVYQRKNNETGEWVKYYAYSDLLPEGINADESLITDIYMSPEAAAKDGYHHDPLYMN